MNLGTDVLLALAPVFGATVRFRRYEATARADGGVNLEPLRILGVGEDLAVITYSISERKAAALFGADIRATALAVINTEIGELVGTGDQMRIMDGTLAGRVYQISGRLIDEAGKLGGVVTLGLDTVGTTRNLGDWE